MTTQNGSGPTSAPVAELCRPAMGRLRPATRSDGELLDLGQQAEQSRLQRQREERLRQAAESWRLIKAAVGARYASVTLAGFECPTLSHQAARDAVAGYVRGIEENRRDGRGLLLHGPRGVGKDHLAVAALRECARAGFTAQWFDGQELFGAMRDSLSRDGGEAALIRRYTGADILLISDPIPPEGKISEFQQSVLWRIVDRRYRSLRSTWLTANCRDGDELSQRLGPQLTDRLTHAATVVSMVGIASFRKPHQVVAGR